MVNRHYLQTWQRPERDHVDICRKNFLADLAAKLDTFVADEDIGTGDKIANFVLLLAAKRAIERRSLSLHKTYGHRRLLKSAHRREEGPRLILFDQ